MDILNGLSTSDSFKNVTRSCKDTSLKKKTLGITLKNIVGSQTELFFISALQFLELGN